MNSSRMRTARICGSRRDVWYQWCAWSQGGEWSQRGVWHQHHPVNRQTHVKSLPFSNFAGGNEEQQRFHLLNLLGLQCLLPPISKANLQIFTLECDVCSKLTSSKNLSLSSCHVGFLLFAY